jgi:hypothetical protein
MSLCPLNLKPRPPPHLFLARVARVEHVKRPVLVLLLAKEVIAQLDLLQLLVLLLLEGAHVCCEGVRREGRGKGAWGRRRKGKGRC